MIVFFTRHGESEANLLGEFSNTGLKHPLTARGRTQATDLASRPELANARMIFSSPVLRAVETAGILGERLGIPVEITPSLREFDVGLLEGRSDEAAWTEFKQVVHAWLERGAKDLRLPAGESYADIQARFLPFMDHLAARFNGTRENQVILVSHGGLYLTMLPLLLENVETPYARTHPIGYTGVVVARVENGSWLGLSWCGERLTS